MEDNKDFIIKDRRVFSQENEDEKDDIDQRNQVFRWLFFYSSCT